MKIVFVCGSVELGRDGVGDYTRQLGLELVNQGHEVRIVGINDNVAAPHLEQVSANEHQQIEICRLPASLTWTNRMYKLDRLLNEFKPDWVSIQYVPYSFHSKGIPYHFVKSFKCLHKKWKWHIMFHETWLGLSSLSPLKHKVVGFFQRKVAKWLVHSLKPVSISTSNRLYQIVLDKAGISSSIIPLFSNIPFADPSSDLPTQVIQKLNLESELNDYIIVGIFGSLHIEYNFEEVITEELKKTKAQNKQLLFLSFGRMGNPKEFERLKKIFQQKVAFRMFGELPEAQVSYTMQVLNLAISCTPFEHIGKSGVYAALRLHNVKVLLPFSDKIPELEGEIKEYNNYLHSRPSYKWSVNYVATKYVKFLDKI